MTATLWADRQSKPLKRGADLSGRRWVRAGSTSSAKLRWIRLARLEALRAAASCEDDPAPGVVIYVCHSDALGWTGFGAPDYESTVNAKVDVVHEVQHSIAWLRSYKSEPSQDAQSHIGPSQWADPEEVVTLFRLITGRIRPWPPLAGILRRSAGRAQPLPPPERTVDDQANDPESRCRALLESLVRGDLDPNERRKLIIESEFLPFRGRQAAALLPFLRRYIDEYRASNTPADLVAVGSAIRNYVATATVDEAFAAAASLLKADGRLPLPVDLEVEVTKMVAWKLTANPPLQRSRYTELAVRLAEVVDAYVKPRFLPREKHGAVALNAVLGLVLARSGRDADVIARMQNLGVPWFQQLVGRRAAKLRSDLLAHRDSAAFADTMQTLEQLSELDVLAPMP